MNDGQYIAIRSYLEELASQGKKIIAGQQRTNELLEQIASVEAKRQARLVKEIDSAITQMLEKVVNTAETGPIKQDAHLAAVTQQPKTATKKGK